MLGSEDTLKFALWKAAKATTVQDFTRRMEELATLDEKAAAWFHDKSPTHWSRSHFSTHPKSDMLLNNLCETFNCNILDVRAKSVLTLLEWIREYLMIRKWDLTGIPCKHALCAILCDNGNPEEYVHDCYTVDTFLKVYEHSIKPMNRPELWEKTGYIPLLHPKFRKGVGRPKKLRLREVDEPAQKQKKKSRGIMKGSRLERQQRIVKCKGCGLGKHNIKTCKRVLRDETNPPVNRVPDEQPLELLFPLAKDRVETAEDIYSELLQSECLDDIMIDATDSIMEYGENEPSTNAPKKFQVKKKRKTTSTTHTLETHKCIGEDPCPRMDSELPERRLAPATVFVPTPGLPPRPTLPPFVPPRTAPPPALQPPPFVPPRTRPPQSLPPLPPPAPTSQATTPQKGVNIRASQHFSHRVCLQPKINKDQIEKSSSSFIMKDGNKYANLSNLNKVIGDK
ncbi:UNVERIFIED_CONTAM: hypothetical protein Scaly_2199000 [Sesamum calycinum]|uniref:Zinc finger PMZ-type domain-containing protein n=1 Tax=Sesamum calycinum TaxID=2727403 RepID=A0AAW2MP74_9LAMI